MIEVIALGLALLLVAAGALAWRQRENAAGLQRLTAVQTRRLAELAVQLDEKDRKLAGLEQRLAEYNNTAGYKLALALTLANSAFDALVVVDQECRLIAINDSAEELFNVDPENRPIGKSVAEINGLSELESIVSNALHHQEEAFEEQVNLGERNFRVRSQVIRRDGHLFIGLALQDITRLVRLNRARRDMVANISHELRHPIANIRLIIDSLFHDQDKPKRKDSISSLRAIARETDALMWLVQEMSDLAMIESGQSIVRMVGVPLNEMVSEAIERIEDFSQVKNITVVREIPASLFVLCDRDLAQRVLVNLLHNAVKWAPSGGRIIVRAADSGLDEVVISVLDNGPGVPDDHVERIFERFYQVDSSRSAGEGTGLGLAICRHIVQAHGGRIWAEGNSRGAGGRFLFTLLKAEDESLNESNINAITR